jgi:pyrroline-5-carboxylate reductase
MSIAFIGGGNMARSMIAGLKRRGMDPHLIHVAEPVDALRTELSREFGVRLYAHASAAAAHADTIVLAVKPQIIDVVCADLQSVVAERLPLVISIAAGVTMAQLKAKLGPLARIVRAMPNTPALLGVGITGWHAGADISASERMVAEQVLGACGDTVWIEHEAQMDAVTAVSGSGPAYFFLLTEALAAAGVAQGLPEATAQRLARITCAGAGAMLNHSDEPVSLLRERVTSPGGTTAAALASFRKDDFAAIVARAVAAATQRGLELSGG